MNNNNCFKEFWTEAKVIKLDKKTKELECFQEQIKRGQKMQRILVEAAHLIDFLDLRIKTNDNLNK